MVVVCYIVIPVGVMVIAFIMYTVIMTVWGANRLGFSTQPRLIGPVAAVAAGEEERSVSSERKSFSVSTYKYGSRRQKAGVPSGRICAVCLSGFEDEEYVQELPHCKHFYHAHCIDEWLQSHSNCPMCRSSVDELDPDESTVEGQGHLDIIISS